MQELEDHVLLPVCARPATFLHTLNSTVQLPIFYHQEQPQLPPNYDGWLAYTGTV